MNATKQFKIGEYAVGGIIQVTLKGEKVEIKALDWTSKKEVQGNTFSAFEDNAYWKINDFLNDLTSSYYAEKVREWIETKTQLQGKSFFR